VQFAGDLDRPDSEFETRNRATVETASFTTKRFQFDLEAYDIAKTLFGMFLVSTGDLEADRLNTSEEFTAMNVISRRQVVEALGFNADRTFRINGVKFRLDGDRLVRLASGDVGHQSASDAAVASRLKAIRSVMDAPASGAGDITSAFLQEKREALLRDHRYAYFSFEKTDYVGTNDFREVIANGTVFADSVFFSLSAAYSMLESAKVPKGFRVELAPLIASHISNDVFSRVLAIPPSDRDTLHRKIGETIKAFSKDAGLRAGFEGTLRSTLDAGLTRLDEILNGVNFATPPEEVRAKLGASFQNGIYTIPRLA